MIISCLLSAAGLALSGLLVLSLSEKPEGFRTLVLSPVLFLLGYIFACVPLFCAQHFSVAGALGLEAAVLACGCLIRFLLLRKRGKRFLRKPDFRLKARALPLLLLLAVTLVLSLNPFGFFGMGQDQGVYQVRAIDLMYGRTDRVYHFEETDRLETEEEQAAFYSGILSSQEGLNLNVRITEQSVYPAFLDPEPDAERPGTDGIYHGLPTYPALLALWGTLFGLEALPGIQAFILLMAVGVLWLTAENLKLKPWAALLMCGVYALSPQILWNARSTLTEGMLSLIIALLTYLLTNRERPDRRWMSAVSVAAFAVFHVSIYVTIHFFALLYLFLYLHSGEKQYLRAMSLSAGSFLIGFAYMLYVSPGYTVNNTKPIWIGPVNWTNAHFLLLAAGAFWLLLSLIARGIRVKGKFRRWTESKGFFLLLRLCVLGLLLFSAALTIRHIPRVGVNVISTNAMYILLWMTGVILLPPAVWVLLRRPGELLREEHGPAILFLFLTLVLFMNCVLIRHLQHCYYYGRYLVPYLPVSCVLIGLVWNRFSGKTVGICSAAAALALLPFDAVLLTQRDDTRGSYSTILQLADAVRGEDSAVVLREARTWLLPVKAVSGSHCYPAGEDWEAQCARLSEQYDTVYYITQDSLDRAPEKEIPVTLSSDDERGHRIPLCPFPLGFETGEETLRVYRYSPE